MAKFNVAAARQSGLNDDQIKQFLASRPDLTPDIPLESAQAPQNPEKSFIESLGSAVLDPFAKVGKGLMGGFQNTGSTLRLLAGKGDETDYKRIVQDNEFNKSNEQLLKGTAGVASYAVPGGATVKGAMGAGALSGGLSSLSQDEVSPESLAGGALFGAGVSGGLSALGRGLQGKLGKSTRITPDSPMPDIPNTIDDSANVVRDLVPTQPNLAGELDLNVLKNADDKAAASMRDQVDQYLSTFTVPTKRAKDLKPRVVAEKMLKYGVAGDMDELAAVTQKVTGDKGLLTQITRSAVKNSKAQIDLGEEFFEGVASKLSDIIEMTPDEAKTIYSKIVRHAQKNQAMPASDLFKLQQQLEKTAQKYKNASTYLTPNVRNEQIGEAFDEASGYIMKKLEGSIKDAKLIDAYKTPEVLNALRSISPGLADDFMKAQTLADVRGLASPFVKLSQIIELTDNSANSAAANLSKRLESQFDKIPDGWNLQSFTKAITNWAKDDALKGASTTAANTSDAVKQVAQGAGTSQGKGFISRTGDAIKDMSALAGSGIEKSAIPTTALLLQNSQNKTNDRNTDHQQKQESGNVQSQSYHNADTMPPITQTVNSPKQTQSGLTRENLAAIMMIDLQKTGGKNISKIKALADMLPEEPKETKVSAKQQEAVMKLNQAESILTNMERQIMEIGPGGRIGGNVKNIAGGLGLNAKAKVYNDMRLGVLSMLAKSLGEAGSLSDGDINRAITLIPAIEDTEEEVKLKFAEIRNIISMGKQNAIQAPTAQSEYLPPIPGM